MIVFFAHACCSFLVLHAFAVGLLLSAASRDASRCHKTKVMALLGSFLIRHLLVFLRLWHVDRLTLADKEAKNRWCVLSLFNRFCLDIFFFLHKDVRRRGKWSLFRLSSVSCGRWVTSLLLQKVLLALREVLLKFVLRLAGCVHCANTLTACKRNLAFSRPFHSLGL